MSVAKNRQTTRFLWLRNKYPLNRIRSSQWANIWQTSRSYSSRVINAVNNVNGKPTMFSDKAMHATIDYLNNRHSKYFNFPLTDNWFQSDNFDQSIFRHTIEIKSFDTVKLRHSSVRKLCDMVIHLKGKASYSAFFKKLGYKDTTAGKLGSDLQNHVVDFPVIPVLYRIDKRYKINVWYVLVGEGDVLKGP